MSRTTGTISNFWPALINCQLIMESINIFIFVDIVITDILLCYKFALSLSKQEIYKHPCLILLCASEPHVCAQVRLDNIACKKCIN